MNNRRITTTFQRHVSARRLVPNTFVGHDHLLTITILNFFRETHQ